MAISIEMYRQSIGTFVPSLRIKKSKPNKNNLSYISSRKFIILKYIISLIIITSITFGLLLIEDAECRLQENAINERLPTTAGPVYINQDTFINFCDKETIYSWIVGMTLNWPYANVSTNLSHYIYGNRRNVGYRYFSWNCDRGLLSKHKIEDIKLFAARHKPHFMGISEVDLRRNESNNKENSTNEFSTEQVHEALKIEGFKLILPPSWVKHNKARIIVFVNEEINAKLIQPKDDETYFPHIF